MSEIDHGIPEVFKKLHRMTEAQKRWIDNAPYDTLIRKWKNDTLGADDIFRGESGVYYLMVMYNKREVIEKRALAEMQAQGRA